MTEVATELREAAAEYERLRERADETEHIDTLADAYERVERTLDQYEERATDWDDFEGYVRFREALGKVYADLPDAVTEREAFEAADEHLTTGVSSVLSESDFEQAREALAPARERAELREDLAEARERYRKARGRAEARRSELESTLERKRRLDAIDFDAPVERLRDPIQAYDEAVTGAFQEYKHDAPAREVLGLVERAASFPLLDIEAPPDRLLSFVRVQDVGEEPIPKLLEFADYSTSKLSHYVDDPGELRGAVATNRTYLDRLSGEPFTVGWPPMTAGELRYFTEEVESVVRAFADEETLAALRRVRALARDPDYDHLRESAVAREEFDEDATVADDTEALEAELTELGSALADCPGP
ncbi:DUF7118 family protein [Natronomonas sp. EA1]|uniref:DUF7118 family protein n=1 Tax=Natronomonas sp. EA1 TaxID=3421655 RepID=UPI003EB8FB8A